jgi:hypothetical protein
MRRRQQGRQRLHLGWLAVVIAIAGLAAAGVIRPVRAQQVAQSSDFLKNQEKWRREAERLRSGGTVPQTKKNNRSTRRSRTTRTRRSEKPPKPISQEARRSEKPPKPISQEARRSEKPPKPISQEARRTKPKPPAEQPKKQEPKKKPESAAREVPPGRPAYIRTKQAPVAKSLGAELAHKIFSHEFTPVRQLAISRSARVVPGYECPRDPAVALTDIVPFKVKPNVSSWIESYVVGCKPRTKRSFLVLLEDGKPQFAELLPGLSIADPLLQRDAVTGAQASAKEERPKGCDKSVVSDTRLAEPLTGGGRPWVELWTLDQCGTEQRIEMRFTPSKDGGTRWAARLIK